MKVILSPDGKTAYVSTGRGKQVFTIDTATDKVTGSFEVGQRPWGIALSPTASSCTQPTVHPMMCPSSILQRKLS